MPATVTAVHQLPQTASSGLTAADATETFYYVVQLSEQDGALGARTARDAAGVPALGSEIAGTGLVLLRKRAELESGDESGIHYRITCEYGTNPDNDTSGGSSGEPWTRKDKIQRRTQAYTIYKDADLEGTPIQNSAGDLYLGGLPFEQYNPVKVVNRYRKHTDLNPEVAEACVGTINSASFTLKPKRGNVTIAAGTALLKSFTCNDAVWPASNLFYFDITFELEIYKAPTTAYGTDGIGQVPIEHYYVTNKGYNYKDGGTTLTPFWSEGIGASAGTRTPREGFLQLDGDQTSTYNANLYDLPFVKRLKKDWAAWINV